MFLWGKKEGGVGCQGPGLVGLLSPNIERKKKACLIWK